MHQGGRVPARRRTWDTRCKLAQYLRDPPDAPLRDFGLFAIFVLLDDRGRTDQPLLEIGCPDTRDEPGRYVVPSSTAS